MSDTVYFENKKVRKVLTMSTIKDRIINILDGNTNPDREVIERIQMMLLYDCNQNVGSNFIQEIAKNGKTKTEKNL